MRCHRIHESTFSSCPPGKATGGLVAAGREIAARSASTCLMAQAAMKRIEEILYPQLQSFPAIDRKRALRRARETPFDVIELLGMAAGLVLVTALTRYGVSELGIGERFAMAIVNFVVAVPLLAIALGPFIVRRVRRGLRAELENRQDRSGM